MKEFNLTNLLRKNVVNLKPYSSARDDFQGSASVYLDANENPFPSLYNRYPDPHQQKLKEALSIIKHVPTQQIFLGNGSDEPIDLLFRAFCEPGVDNVLIPQPTYGMYSVSAEINDVKIISVKLTPEFDLDLESIHKAWNANTKLLFLCSPNNPSGNLLSEGKIEILLQEFNGLVIVDEAYIDFTGKAGFVPLLKKYPNLVVLQTLSKAWGLAGIRLGMCFASTEIVTVLNKIKPPYNISVLSQQVALETIQNEQKKNTSVMEIIAERKRVSLQLVELPIVKMVFPSDSNFLLVRITEAKQVYQKLVSKGIIVRDRSSVILCEDCLRITIGTKQENEVLIQALKNL